TSRLLNADEIAFISSGVAMSPSTVVASGMTPSFVASAHDYRRWLSRQRQKPAHLSTGGPGLFGRLLCLLGQDVAGPVDGHLDLGVTAQCRAVIQAVSALLQVLDVLVAVSLNALPGGLRLGTRVVRQVGRIRPAD